ncbi:hypothetical protein SETIT_3G390100v2 [Setaria italica]|uniref:Nuclear transcription factor Y subunit n=1 Tax=Setaria italica TaxID=4555 RepID=K3ZDK3_SETIT|nr:hypothetical protein SETIT_3G390100v2 [Setaria italica]
MAFRNRARGGGRRRGMVRVDGPRAGQAAEGAWHAAADQEGGGACAGHLPAAAIWLLRRRRRKHPASLVDEEEGGRRLEAASRPASMVVSSSLAIVCFACKGEKGSEHSATVALQPPFAVYNGRFGPGLGQSMVCADTTDHAKQFEGIFHWRRARAKTERVNRLVKARKPYLQESRHLHALCRARGSGGRFLNTKKIQQSDLGNLSSVSSLSGSEVSSIYDHEDVDHYHSFHHLYIPFTHSRASWTWPAASEGCCDLLRA